MTVACLSDPRGDRIETGWFVDGTQPKSFCECHALVDYDISGAGIAFGDCLKEDDIIKVANSININTIYFLKDNSTAKEDK